MSKAKALETYRRLLDPRSPPICPVCEKPLKEILIEVIEAKGMIWDKNVQKYDFKDYPCNNRIVKVYCERCGKSLNSEMEKIVLGKLGRIL